MSQFNEIFGSGNTRNQGGLFSVYIVFIMSMCFIHVILKLLAAIFFSNSVKRTVQEREWERGSTKRNGGERHRECPGGI